MRTNKTPNPESEGEMSVGRRGFLGLLAAAPVAGPAAAQMAQYSPGVPTGANSGLVSRGVQTAGRQPEPSSVVRRAFKAGLVSKETLLEHLRGSTLSCNEFPQAHQLDADLQALRSFSLSARVLMQRDRNRDRTVTLFLEEPKDIWALGRQLIEQNLMPDEPRP